MQGAPFAGSSLLKLREAHIHNTFIDFSYYLFSPDIVSLDQVFPPNELTNRGFEPIALSGGAVVDGAEFACFYKAPEPNDRGGWKDFISTHFDVPDPGLPSSSPSVLLLVRVAGRVFAIPFGQARHAIPDDRIEQDFGIATTLNKVKGRLLSQITILTPGARRKTTSIDRRYEGPAAELAVGRDADILDRAGGHIEEGDKRQKISGRESLRWKAAESLDSLVETCREILSWYQEDDGRDEDISALSSAQPIKEASATDRLTRDLFDSLAAGNFDDFSILEPTGEDSDNSIVRTEIKFDREWIPFPTTTTGFEQWFAGPGGANRRMNWDDLKKLRLRMTHADGTERYTSVLSLSSAVIKRGTSAFYLDGSRWYRTTAKYVEQINAFVQAIDAYDGPRLEEFDHRVHRRANKASEAEYNDRVAQSLGFLNCDLPARRFNGETEVCDMLSPSLDFYHVKRGSGFGATSYACSQAFVSADRLCGDLPYRRFCSQLWPAANSVGQTPWDRRSVTFVVTLISKNAAQPREKFSFNAKRELARLAQDLIRLDIPLELARVLDASP